MKSFYFTSSSWKFQATPLLCASHNFYGSKSCSHTCLENTCGGAKTRLLSRVFVQSVWPLTFLPLGVEGAGKLANIRRRHSPIHTQIAAKASETAQRLSLQGSLVPPWHFQNWRFVNSTKEECEAAQSGKACLSTFQSCQCPFPRLHCLVRPSAVVMVVLNYLSFRCADASLVADGYDEKWYIHDWDSVTSRDLYLNVAEK